MKWPKIPQRPLLVAIAVILLASLITGWATGRIWRARTDKLLKRADAARVKTAADSAVIESLLASGIAWAREGDSLRRVAVNSTVRATAAEGEAARLRKERGSIVPVSSQPGLPPSVADTLTATRTKLDLCESETAVLREAAVHLRNANDLMTADAARNASRIRDLTTSLTTSQGDGAELRKFNIKLAQDLLNARAPERCLFWNCPSRKTVFVVGALGGATAAVVLVKR
jgi:hypothetical protein